jgi:SAM-dependent methyltransferase
LAIARSITARLDRRFYPDEGSNWDNRRFTQCLRQQLKETDVVLDFGAGRGKSNLFDFRGHAARIVGVDVDREIEQNPYLDEYHVLRPDGRIPLTDESIDLVYSCNVLEHVQNPGEALVEIGRVLKPGGLFLAKTPNRHHYVALAARCTPLVFHKWFNKKRGRAEHDTFPTCYRCNSRRQILNALRGSALELHELQFWEGRPEYTRLFPLMYLFGIGYERLVNSTERLAPLRAVLVMTLKKAISARTSKADVSGARALVT